MVKKFVLTGLTALTLSLTGCDTSLIKIRKFDVDEPKEIDCRNDFSDFERIVESTYGLRVKTTYVDHYVTDTGNYLEGARHSKTVNGSAFAFARDNGITYLATSASLLPQNNLEGKKEDGKIISLVSKIENVELELVRYLDNREVGTNGLSLFLTNRETDSAVIMGYDLDKSEFPVYGSFVDQELLKEEKEFWMVGYSSDDKQKKVKKLDLTNKKKIFGTELEQEIVGSSVFVMHNGLALLSHPGILRLIEDNKLSYLIKRHKICKK